MSIYTNMFALYLNSSKSIPPPHTTNTDWWWILGLDRPKKPWTHRMSPEHWSKPLWLDVHPGLYYHPQFFGDYIKSHYKDPYSTNTNKKNKHKIRHQPTPQGSNIRIPLCLIGCSPHEIHQVLHDQENLVDFDARVTEPPGEKQRCNGDGVTNLVGTAPPKNPKIRSNQGEKIQQLVILPIGDRWW